MKSQEKCIEITSEEYQQKCIEYLAKMSKSFNDRIDVIYRDFVDAGIPESDVKEAINGALNGIGKKMFDATKTKK